MNYFVYFSKIEKAKVLNVHSFLSGKNFSEYIPQINLSSMKGDILQKTTIWHRVISIIDWKF